MQRTQVKLARSDPVGLQKVFIGFSPEPVELLTTGFLLEDVMVITRKYG